MRGGIFTSGYNCSQQGALKGQKLLAQGIALGMMCGATAIEIGTANFIDPAVTKKVKDGMNEWLDAHGCKSVTEIIGAIK